MPHVEPLQDAQASAAAKTIFQALQAKIGMVPNIFRAMGHAPDVLKATLDLNSAIQHELPAKLRELAYLKASQINACDYCTHYHKIHGQKAGLTSQQFQDLNKFEQSNAYDATEKNVLRFAEQWTKEGRVNPDVLKQLNAVLSPTQMIVLAATAGLANWTNRFNETFGMELP